MNICKNLLRRAGFTLMELSVVLIIVGLIAGAALVGRDLIAAARARTQLSQLEKYATAANTFRGKYNGLPGDLAAAQAAAFGFIARSGQDGSGDNDGLVERCNPGDAFRHLQGPFLGCENLLFWTDLSAAQLIAGDFTAATDGDLTNTPASALRRYFPEAVAAQGASLFIGAMDDERSNWFIIGKPGDIDAQGIFAVNGDIRIDAAMAYSMDKKIDNGDPLSGKLRVTWVAFTPAGYFFGLPIESAVACVNNGIYNIAESGRYFCQLAVGF